MKCFRAEIDTKRLNVCYLLLKLGGFFSQLPGLSEVTVQSFEETMNCLQSGSSGRTTGSTAMNTHSSRSHAIFTLHIEQKKKQDM